MPANHDPLTASQRLAEALAHLNIIQPEALQTPIRDLLAAGITTCVSSRSLEGKGVDGTLALAEAVIAASRQEAPRG